MQFHSLTSLQLHNIYLITLVGLQIQIDIITHNYLIVCDVLL